MQATRYLVVFVMACLALVIASAGVPAAAADIGETADNHYIDIDLRQAVELVTGGDPVVIYFRSPT